MMGQHLLCSIRNKEVKINYYFRSNFKRIKHINNKYLKHNLIIEWVVNNVPKNRVIAHFIWNKIDRNKNKVIKFIF